MIRKLTYVGTFRGISKKNNPFAISTFYGDPLERTKAATTGYEVIQIFVNEDIENDINSLKPLQVVTADVRFIGGQNVLVSVK